MTKFHLSIDLFTPDVRDSADVAQALGDVAEHLTKFTTLPWSPYALSGTIYAKNSKDPKRAIGSWRVDPGTSDDPTSPPRCARCGHVDSRAQVLCTVCASEAVHP